MLTIEGCRTRLERLRSLLTDRGLHQAVLFHPKHVYYFSGPRTANSYELKVVGANGAFDPNRPYRLRFTMNPGAPIPTGHE